MNSRKQYLVDRQTQIGIAVQLVALWFAGIVIVAGFPIFAMLIYGGMVAQLPLNMIFSQIVEAIWFPMMMSVIVVPLGIWYSIRFSNRLAGPVFRIKRELGRLESGEEAFQVTLRRGDFFTDLADSYNNLRVRFMRLEARNRQLELEISALESHNSDPSALPAGTLESVSPGLTTHASP